MFKGPSSWTLCFTTLSTSLITETSPNATVDFLPSWVISWATSSAPCLFAEMSLMQTSYPSFARRMAMDLPLSGNVRGVLKRCYRKLLNHLPYMPRAEPVTIAVRGPLDGTA